MPTQSSAAAATVAPVVALQRPEKKKPSAKATRDAATNDPAALSPAAARKQLRAATKARKHYERGEVRRFTWRSRRRRRTWLVLGGAVAALVAFVVVGAYSPLMALRTIEVVGTNRIPAEQVQAALSAQIGTPLPIVDGDQIKRELSTFTLIQSYSTESRPPNTLVVRIVERVPVGLLTTAGGFELVDAAGVALQSGAERVPGYPVIIATNGVGHPGFTAAAAVIRALPESIRTQLDSVTAATTDDVTLTLAGGERIVWGSAERSDYKAVVLAALMVTYPPGSVGEYDVTSPDSAVLR
ncbi:FtsQ-type POTRA domain-containing protein [Leifsonia kafniensis]|uniref:FtsQ-type POTRA domain-containing protein n=1 Tax=Leifsonia kafniensis TaxID=475957 RepID=A0ABP7K3L0_9MICO